MALRLASYWKSSYETTRTPHRRSFTCPMTADNLGFGAPNRLLPRNQLLRMLKVRVLDRAVQTLKVI